MADRYAGFIELSQHEREGIDYAIEIAARSARFAVIAPHGGFTEPHTTMIARAIAGTDLSFYSFTGLREGRRHEDLHITSHRFDEPRCLALLDQVESVVAIHGKRDIDDALLVYLGGLDTALRDRLRDALSASGFAARFDAQRYPGIEPMNICNRGQSRRGVQLELPRSLRGRLASDEDRLKQFSVAVRAALLG
jgi:phage replication-related protein YjqB (UPF0714/DUF867 family)